MTIKVGINGFGRIGRMVFRAVYNLILSLKINSKFRKMKDDYFLRNKEGLRKVG